VSRKVWWGCGHVSDEPGDGAGLHYDVGCPYCVAVGNEAVAETARERAAVERLRDYLAARYPGKEASQAVLAAQTVVLISSTQILPEKTSHEAWPVKVDEMADHLWRVMVGSDPTVAVAAAATAICRLLSHARIGCYTDPDPTPTLPRPVNEVQE